MALTLITQLINSGESDRIERIISVNNTDKFSEAVCASVNEDELGLIHRENFRSNYLKPALERGFVEMTIPEKSNSRLQRYRLTNKGTQLRKTNKK